MINKIGGYEHLVIYHNLGMASSADRLTRLYDNWRGVAETQG